MENGVIFKDEFEKLGYSFEVSETDRGIDVWVKPGKLMAKAQVTHGILDVEIKEQIVSDDIFDYFREVFIEMNEGYEIVKTNKPNEDSEPAPKIVKEWLLKWIEEMAKYKKCGCVVIKGEVVNILLQEKGYMEIKGEYEPFNFILNKYRNKEYIKVIDESTAFLIKNVGHIIGNFLENYHQKDETMEYSLEGMNKIPIYVNGYEGNIEIDYQQTFYLKEKNIKQTFPFSSVEELEKACQDLFKKIDEKQRIKNVLQAPRYHFDHYFTLFKQTAKNEVYAALETVMTPNEIELYCAKKRAEHTKVPIERVEHFRVFKVDDRYFIIEEQFGIEHMHIKTSIEETEAFIFEEITKNKKQAIKNALLLL